MSTKLEKFFDKPENMHAREAILMHRLLYDLQLSAARGDYYLNCYFDDVDHDGFDVIFDDQDLLTKIQVKSIRKNAKTKSWDIHKRILRPQLHMLDKFGFESSPEGEGVQGGVVIMEYSDTSHSLDVEYCYTDLHILMAFECEIIKRKHKAQIKAVDNCLDGLCKGLGSDRLSVPKAAFVNAKDTPSLLSLVGLHGTTSSSWRHSVLLCTNHTRQHADRSMNLPMDLSKLIENTGKSIINLVSDNNICI